MLSYSILLSSSVDVNFYGLEGRHVTHLHEKASFIVGI